jgi:hypothetical protein
MLRRTEDRVSIEVICGSLLRVEGIALDVSENELRLELERPLSKEMSVEIIFAEGALILFGELEYCQPAERGEDDLILYLAAEGLTSPEVIRLQQHLKRCAAYRARLDQEQRLLDRIGSNGMESASGHESVVALPKIAQEKQKHEYGIGKTTEAAAKAVHHSTKDNATEGRRHGARAGAGGDDHRSERRWVRY